MSLLRDARLYGFGLGQILLAALSPGTLPLLLGEAVLLALLLWRDPLDPRFGGAFAAAFLVLASPALLGMDLVPGAAAALALFGGAAYVLDRYLELGVAA